MLTIVGKMGRMLDMPRAKRCTPGGMVYHVLNRGDGRMTLFEDDADYRVFLRVVGETLRLVPMRICGFCLMPNHWHMLLWSTAGWQLQDRFSLACTFWVARER